MDVTCANDMHGDGIRCIVMENFWMNCPENSLVQYIRPLLVHTSSSPSTTYQVTDVAVLQDCGYKDDKIGAIQQILQEHSPGIAIHM